ncbi:MAG: hypothetical protein H6839_08770 [Planctomycetes bacterium]|nr:hypothetical protein [Planctomycetota bacterium]
MRTLTIAVVLMLLTAGVLADETQLTPRQSFEKFVDVVMREDMTEADRAAAFESYFDFDTWLGEREKSDGKTYNEDERADMKRDWLDLFRSAEFRDSWRKRKVRVLEEPMTDRESGKAELVISMTGAAGAEEKFRVLMTLADDGSHWRWYSIPQIEAELPAPSLSERLENAEKQLDEVIKQRRRLEAYEQKLLEEIARMRAELAEQGGGDSPYGTPKSVVETAWRAIEKGDANALLDCHTTRRIAGAKTADVNASLKKTRDRLMSWSVVDSTIDANDAGQAVVRVKLTLQQTGEPDERTVSIRVVKIGELWKIDEEP